MRKYPVRPWLGVGVVVHKGDKVLLIKRGKEPNKGKWSLPGGAQDTGETVMEAASREVLEETGLYIKDTQIIDVVDSITKDDNGKVLYHYTLIEIGALWHDGEPKANSDAEEVMWAGVETLDNFDLPPITRDIVLKSYRSRKDSLTEA